MTDQTTEGRVLARYPEVREAVARSAEFQQWLASVPTVVIDGETFYLSWSDVPRDLDQVTYDWARGHGLLTDSRVEAALDS